MTTDDLRVEPRGGEASTGSLLRLSPRAGWRLALGLLIAGGALSWIDCALPWALPWATARVSLPFNPGIMLTEGVSDPALTALFALLRPSLNRHPALIEPILGAIWFVYLALGLAIALALITRHRARIRAVLLLAYALWLTPLIAPLLVLSAALATGQGGSFVGHVLTNAVLVSRPAPSVGLWLGWLAALLGGFGLFCARQALRRGLRESSSARLPTLRAAAELISAGLATAGVVVWEVGFFALPWATQGCSGLHVALNHFHNGTCSGRDSADMLATWSMTSSIGALLSPPDNPLASATSALTNLTLLSMLVAIVTLWAVARLWIGPQGVGRYGWLLTCLILSGAIALLAWRGAVDALVRPESLTFSATAPWVYGPGVLVTFAGLAVAALGLVGAYHWSASGASLMWPVSSRSRPKASSVREKM